MKKICTILMFIVLAFNAKAQLPAGADAPDFTGTDINGNTWHLFELLDQGKTVIMDISATWCGPCWGYHGSGALEGLYAALGEEGAKNTVVLFVEGDGATTLADLNGTGGNTQGNWVAGTPYPIIDDANIADLYAISYFPTIYKICPATKKVYELNQLGTSELVTEILNPSCMAPTAGTDAAYAGYTGSDVACEGGAEMKLKVLNNGTTAITNITAEAKINNAVVATQSWTGNLTSYQLQEINLGDVPVTATSDVVLHITSTTDDNTTNNEGEKSVAIAPFAQTNSLKVDILTDNYGGETYWEVRSPNGTVLGKGGNEAVGPTGGGQYTTAPASATAYGNNASSSTVVPLSENGCFDFFIVDAYGDGMCCAYGSGYYKVYDNNNNLILEGGQFAASKDNPLEASATSDVKDVTGLNNIKVFPNPVSDLLTVSFHMENTSDLNVNITNTFGQVIKTLGSTQYASGTHNLVINTADFSNGVYIININNAEGTTSRKFTVSK